MTRRAAVLVLAAAAAVSLTACSSSGTPPDGGTTAPGTPSTPSPPATSSTPMPSTTAATSSAPAGHASSSPSTQRPSTTPPATSAPTAGAACRDGQLRISAGAGNGAGGHDAYVLRFRNVSARGCSPQGYPGVDVLASDGRVLAHAARTPYGFMGGSRAGARRVVLLPGGVASAVVEWANVDAQHPSGRGCDLGAAIAVTAANTYDAVRFARSGVGVCSLQVHPTVAGRTGSDGTP
ncbi:DUF4232 domain-containing protein [Jatrophihabitans fulvus]